jgi:hypothetical protein
MSQRLTDCETSGSMRDRGTHLLAHDQPEHEFGVMLEHAITLQIACSTYAFEDELGRRA